MKKLPHPDNFHLDAATGWLLLGDLEAAKTELGRLTPVSREDPAALEVEWDIDAKVGSWDHAYQVAERLVTGAPEVPFGWIHRAYAARRMPGGGLTQAWHSLRPAAEKFPNVFLIPYNLACYAAQMGQAEEAWGWLLRAAKAAGSYSKIKTMALEDADLKPLWPKIRTDLKPVA